MGIEPLESIRSQLDAMPGSVLLERQLAALQYVEESGIPGRHLETWKYTDGKTFITQTTGIATNTDLAPLKSLQESYLAELGDCYTLVLLNGFFQKENSTRSVPEELEVLSFAEADAALLEKIGNTPKLGESVFASLNLAGNSSGVILRVPAGVTLTKPIVIFSCVTEAAKTQMIFPRIFVDIAESASARIIEIAVSELQAEYSSFTVVEGLVARNARLSYIQINQHSAAASVFNAFGTEQDSDSTVQTGVFSFGGKTTRNEIYSTISGQNARSEIVGLAVLSDSQQVDNHTVLDHAVPHCESFELVKGVYSDSAKGTFDGTIIVRPDAQKTNAIQSNQSLLLSDRATSNAKPQLKIWADDVKCTHGATVGQLDETGMFYLRSRGISEVDARTMLIHAFASEVVSAVDQGGLKTILESMLTTKLADL